MKFLEKNKKLICIIAVLCFALTLVLASLNLLASLGNLFVSFRNCFMMGGGSLSNVLSTLFNTRFFWRQALASLLPGFFSILSILLGMVCTLLYGICALRSIKKGGRKLLALAGVVMLLTAANSFLSTVVISVAPALFGNFGVNIPSIIGVLVGSVIGLLPVVLFALFLIIGAFIKAKGPAMPIISAVVVLLYGGFMAIASIVAIISFFATAMHYYTGFPAICQLLSTLLGAGAAIIQPLGLLLLVPVAFNICKPAPVTAEEAPAEEAPAEIIAE